MVYRQLQCDRVTLHTHLFTSYILSAISWILYYTLAALNVSVIDNSPVCMLINYITISQSAAATGLLRHRDVISDVMQSPQPLVPPKSTKMSLILRPIL